MKINDINEGAKWDSAKLFHKLAKKSNEVDKLKRNSSEYWKQLADRERAGEEPDISTHISQFVKIYWKQTKRLNDEISAIEQIAVKKNFKKTRRAALIVLRVLRMVDDYNSFMMEELKGHMNFSKFTDRAFKMLDIPDVHKDTENKNESATAGATASNAIASVSNPLRGIQRRPSIFGYVSSKKKTKKKKKKKNGLSKTL